MARILIVDDYPDFGRLLVSLLKVDRHDCRAATTADEAIRVGLEFTPELLIVDWMLKDSSAGGLSVARALHAAFPTMQILVMTGSPEANVRDDLGDLPVAQVLEKPFNALQEVRKLLAPPTQNPM